jgi:hypothetical protein
LICSTCDIRDIVDHDEFCREAGAFFERLRLLTSHVKAPDCFVTALRHSPLHVMLPEAIVGRFPSVYDQYCFFTARKLVDCIKETYLLLVEISANVSAHLEEPSSGLGPSVEIVMKSMGCDDSIGGVRNSMVSDDFMETDGSKGVFMETNGSNGGFMETCDSNGFFMETVGNSRGCECSHETGDAMVSSSARSDKNTRKSQSILVHSATFLALESLPYERVCDLYDRVISFVDACNSRSRHDRIISRKRAATIGRCLYNARNVYRDMSPEVSHACNLKVAI